MDKIQVFSDSHFPIDIKTKKIINFIEEQNKNNSEILFLLWDILDWENTEKFKNLWEKSLDILKELSKTYKKIVYVLWNHEFRDPNLQDEGWYKNFREILPENIIFPKNITEPTKVEVEITKWKILNILVWNLFYDMKFLNPSILWMKKEEILNIYKKFPDWNYLFNWDIEIFKKMKKSIIEQLDTNIDILATHSLPHPSLVQFLYNWKDIEEFKNKVWKNIKVKSPSDRHYKDAKKLWISIEEYIKWYNAKSFFMWSNVLDNPEKIKNWLLSIFWHSHRNTNQKIEVKWKEVNFYSNQYPNCKG